MPMHQMKDVGELIKHRRVDHTVSIPRPDKTERTGTKSACSQCHQGQTPETLQQKLEARRGRIRPQRDVVSKVIEYQQQLGPSLRPTGSLSQLESLSAVAERLDAGSAIEGVHLLTFLAGQMVATQTFQLKPKLARALWRASDSPELDLAAAALTTLVLFEAPTAQRNQSLQTRLEAERRGPSLRAKVVYNLIGLYQAYGRLNAAGHTHFRERLSDEGAIIDTEHHALHLALAADYMSDKDDAMALKHLHRSKSARRFRTPRYPVGVLGGRSELFSLEAAILMRSRQTDDAVNALVQATRLNPNDGQAFARLCQLYEQRSAWRQFTDCLKSWNEYHPHHLPVYTSLAAQMLKLGRTGEAREVIRRGLALFPTSKQLLEVRDLVVK